MHKFQIPRRLELSLVLVLAAGVFWLFSIAAYAQTVKDTHLREQEEEAAAAEAEVAVDKTGDEMTREATEALYNAQETMKEDDFAGARKLLYDYLAAKPPEEKTPIVLYHMLGYAWSADENAENGMDEARKVFKEGHAAAPEDEGLLLNYAIATFEIEMFAEAAPLFEKVFDTQKKKDSKFLQQAAVAWVTAEKLEDAKRVLLRMFSLPEDPKPEWYQLIINVFMELEDMESAEEYVRLYLRQDPLQAPYWRLLAQFLLDKEDYRGAAGALEISYQVKPPAKKKRWADLSDIYYYLSAPLKAAGSLENSLAGKGSDDRLAQLVELYHRAQRFDRAIAYIDQMIAQKPTARLLLQKGNILHEAGRVEDAVKVWGQCADVDPEFGDCLIAKGLGQWDLKDWDGARDSFEAAAELEEVRLQAEDALAVLDDLEGAKYDPSFDFRKGR